MTMWLTCSRKASQDQSSRSALFCPDCGGSRLFNKDYSLSHRGEVLDRTSFSVDARSKHALLPTASRDRDAPVRSSLLTLDPTESSRAPLLFCPGGFRYHSYCSFSWIEIYYLLIIFLIVVLVIFPRVTARSLVSSNRLWAQSRTSSDTRSEKKTAIFFHVFV